MENILSLAFLVVAGLILIFLFVYSFRTRVGSRYQQAAESGPADAVNEDGFDVLTLDVKPGRTEPTLFQIPGKPESYDDYEDEIIAVRAVEPMESPEPVEIKQEFPTESVQVSAAVKQKSRTEILVLYVLPEQGEKFYGYDLLQALLAANLSFGKMSIFHRHKLEEDKVLFSLAQATEPGTFDMDNMGSCQCTGLILFMQLSGLEHNHDALEIFVDTAETLADSLNGQLLDQSRQSLTSDKKLQFVKKVQQHQEELRI